MKKKIKGKVPNKTKRKNYAKNKNVLLIPFILMSIALTLMTYIILGVDFAIIMGILLLIVILVIAMLNNIKNNKRRRRIISILLIILLTFSIIAVVSFCAFVVYIKSIAEPRFKVSKLNTPEITIVYDKDDKEITRLGSERREKVKYEELPEVLVDAIIATEDSRFFSHNGFDAPRFAKAALGQIAGRDSGGASTLSMQVVKNSFTDAKVKSGIPGIIRKFEDIYLAVYKLEKKYTKEEIIEYYVNNHFLGGNIYGVEEAAETYFGKNVSDLNLSEAATIAGMFKSPNFYRPNVNPKNATDRRATVLYLMKRHGYITAEEQEMANSIPMESLTKPEVQGDVIPYQGYIDTVVAEIKDKYGVNPYTTSLKVYTNLDRSKQDGVDNVLNGVTYEWKDDKVQTGVAVLDVETGKILAIGAGRNRTGLSTWNNATDIKRQPGSTAKPLFDYGPGIEYNDWSTAEMFNDAPYHYSNGKAIHNWDNGYYGNITLRRALSASRNIPALKAFQQVDNKKIIKFVTSLGIEPEIENGRIHEAHSIGAFTGVNPLQMAAAYSAFSNGGYYNEPYSVRKIEFRLSGRVEEHHSNKKRVMSDATAFMITSVLQDVQLTQGGTPANVAVKTGTTNFDEAFKAAKGLPADAIRDSWAVGYSTKTAVAMWYGYNTVDKVYCLHNFPATYAKDRLFRALVNSGAMEANRGQWKQPSSVDKIGSEYYKKGHAPKTPTQSSLPAPANLSVSYNESTQIVTLSWGAVPRMADDESFGEFGYKIYKDGVYVGWTTGTSYTMSTSSPSGSYRVVASYKGYSGVEGASATNNYTFKHKNTPEEDCAEQGGTWNGVTCETTPQPPEGGGEGGEETQNP